MGWRAEGFLRRRAAARLTTVVIFVWAASGGLAAEQRANADAIDNEDALAEVKQQNSADYPCPQAPMGDGRVTPIRPRRPSITRAADGAYHIGVSAGQSVLTPAVADGRIFVGGGFSSTEFVCLKAGTGLPAWSVRLSDNGPSAPAYDDGTVIFTTESCTCYALDAITGRKLWAVWLAGSLVTAPTIAGNSVLVAYPGTAGAGAATRPAPTGFVFAARDLRTGRPQWQKWIDNHVISAPVVNGGNVYIVTFSGTLYEFRLRDGDIRMARRCRATSAPVILKDGIYLTRRKDAGRMPQEVVVRLDRRTGEELYSAHATDAVYLADVQSRSELMQPSFTAKWQPTPASSPTKRQPLPGDPDYVPGGAPAVVSDNRPPAIRLVGRDTPQELQSFSGSRLVAFDGSLFNCMGNELLAIDPANGESQWSLAIRGKWASQSGDFAAQPPTVAGNQLFLATRDGQLLRVDPGRGRVTGHIALGAAATSQPVIVGGQIFVGTAKGELVCVNTGDPTLTGWSQWGGDATHSAVSEWAPAAKSHKKPARNPKSRSSLRLASWSQ